MNHGSNRKIIDGLIGSESSLSLVSDWRLLYIHLLEISSVYFGMFVNHLLASLGRQEQYDSFKFISRFSGFDT